MHFFTRSSTFSNSLKSTLYNYIITPIFKNLFFIRKNIQKYRTRICEETYNNIYYLKNYIQ